MIRQLILGATALGFAVLVVLASVPATAQTAATPTPEVPVIVIRPTIAIMTLSGTCRAWRLRVRIGPSKAEAAIFDLQQGELVSILGISTNLQWFMIKTADGNRGWVSRFYMNLVGGHIYNLPVIDTRVIPTLTPSPHP